MKSLSMTIIIDHFSYMPYEYIYVCRELWPYGFALYLSFTFIDRLILPIRKMGASFMVMDCTD